MYFYDALGAETCRVFEFLMHSGLAAQTFILLSFAIDRFVALPKTKDSKK